MCEKVSSLLHVHGVVQRLVENKVRPNSSMAGCMIVSVPDLHARERGSGEFRRICWFFARIWLHDYHVTSATTTYFIWYILAAIELSRTLYKSLKSNVCSVTDKHDNVHKLFVVPNAR